MNNQFAWIEIYQELANTLSGWERRQAELIAFLDGLHRQGYTIFSMQDRNQDDERFLLREIDPFTLFSSFNRGLRDENRLAILAQVKQHFHLRSPLPSDFMGIPVVNNQSSWFFSYQKKRKPDDIPHLWRVFRLALEDKPLDDPQFLAAFDQALTIRMININLTMGLFWIRPYSFLALDKPNRDYLGIALPKEGLTAAFYREQVMAQVRTGKTFPAISLEAWQAANPETPALPAADDVNYWLVGAFWDGQDPPDQTQRFLDGGVWQCGYRERYLDEVKAMKPGDRIAIKAATTQRKGLPFEAHGKTVSRMDIKAAGTIVANRGDGQTVEVEWDPEFQGKSWYFFTHRGTVWQVRLDEGYRLRQYSEKLIAFIWQGQEQEYEWFCEQWWGNDQKGLESEPVAETEPYSIEDMVASGVFLEEEKLRGILERLRSKKALIVQGAPGVGKTFIARKLAFALMEETDRSRLEMVQFHQSYAYDDFVRGYRPTANGPGSFQLQDGVFFRFCERARQDPDREYVFIIDEINRGNLSQIFGELLMLIEADKRGPEFSVPLVYQQPDEERFSIPANVFLLGLMNVADRSLAMVDYALRRRFAFVTLQPQYESELFRRWLTNRGMSERLVDLIVSRMSELNREIREDPLLGENYQVGHSYFCPKGDNFAGLDEGWYAGIVETEIAPLLKEYWYDNSQRADDVIQRVLR